MVEIKYEITEKFGILSESSNGWKKEINLISWNDKPAKFDIRDWSPDGEKMGKGITISLSEAKALRDILNSLELE